MTETEIQFKAACLRKAIELEGIELPENISIEIANRQEFNRNGFYKTILKEALFQQTEEGPGFPMLTNLRNEIWRAHIEAAIQEQIKMLRELAGFPK